MSWFSKLFGAGYKPKTVVKPTTPKPAAAITAVPSVGSDAAISPAKAGGQLADKYAQYLSADPVSQPRRALLWMGPEELGVFKQAADIQGHVDIVTPDGVGAIHSVSKEDIDWAIRVDKLAEQASSNSQRRLYNEAIKHYLVALDASPGADIYLMSVGSCFAMLRDKQNAVRFLQRAHEINPRNEQIIRNLKNCQML